MKTKTIIIGLVALAVAAAGVYGLTQTLGSRDASVAASKPSAKNDLSSKAKKEDDGIPAKMSDRGTTTRGLGF